MQKIVKLSIEEIRDVYKKYMVNDFPDNERKPLAMIEVGMKKGKYECLGFVEDDKLLGYAIFVRRGNNYLFDYLAIVDGNRNAGIGTEFLKHLAMYYKDSNSVIGEVENPEYASTDEERELQKRRYEFYMRNGYVDTGVKVRLFGVNFIVIEMKKDVIHTRKEIMRLYKKHYWSMLPKTKYFKKVKVYKK